MSYAKFCTKCGQQLRMIDAGSFNAQTGKREKEGVCPSGQCGHTGFLRHDWVDTVTPGTWLHDSHYTGVCRRCGHTYDRGNGE